MFPLDGLSSWPRLYGPAGFVQYQLGLPRGRERVLEQLLMRLRRSAVPCYLAVLKDFGAENHAPLSFPLAGWTLALDMPRGAPGLEDLMSAFDELVAGAGGRVYLAKDCRLRPEILSAMYPRLEQWRAVRDRAVVMVNPFRCKILHKKASLAVLSDEINAHLFTAEEQAAITKFIPWTRNLSERNTLYEGRPIDLVPFLVQNKDEFVLKPNDEYGGKGVILGWETDATEWEAYEARQEAAYSAPERGLLES
jgi:hypothetical protein